MKRMLGVLLILMIVSVAQMFADAQIVAIKGDVQIRRGVSEQWVPAALGDILKPDDSMRSGKKSSATIIVNGNQKISVPEMVILDCSDLRMLSREQLLLMLAMERVRSVQPAERDNDMFIPKTSTMHGENIDKAGTPDARGSKGGVLQLNGTRVLYDQGFYATCVLRAKEVFRLNPTLMSKVDARLMVGNALERMKLNGEALGEYLALKKGRLSGEELAIVDKKISALRKKAQG